MENDRFQEELCCNSSAQQQTTLTSVSCRSIYRTRGVLEPGLAWPVFSSSFLMFLSVLAGVVVVKLLLLLLLFYSTSV